MSQVLLVGFPNSGKSTIFNLLSEGSAKVCYEAAACSLPQITTREAGDVVVHEQGGLVIPPSDPTALADAIQQFYRHPEKLMPMGQAGRDRVMDQFTWQHYHNRVGQAYAYAFNGSG